MLAEASPLKMAFPRINISVSDTGIGMNEQAIEKLFQPFEQGHDNDRNYAGTGLGMAIVKRIMNALNGNIDAQSELVLEQQ